MHMFGVRCSDARGAARGRFDTVGQPRVKATQPGACGKAIYALPDRNRLNYVGGWGVEW